MRDVLGYSSKNFWPGLLLGYSMAKTNCSTFTLPISVLKHRAGETHRLQSSLGAEGPYLKSPLQTHMGAAALPDTCTGIFISVSAQSLVQTDSLGISFKTAHLAGEPRD